MTHPGSILHSKDGRVCLDFDLTEQIELLEKEKEVGVAVI